MNRFGEWVVKRKSFILVLSLILLIPSVVGMTKTRINYDILSYLPKDMETMIGQDILLEEFGKGGFSMVMIQGMEDKEVSEVKNKIMDIEGVADVVWYDTITDITIPKEVLPDNIYEFFNSDDSTLMAVFFSDTTSADVTMNAIEEMRKIAEKQCFVSGMSAIITDTKNISNEESVAYVAIASILTGIVLAVTMDSALIPVFFLLSIGMSIIYNLGSNIFLGEISFITKALSAVLQLGVTMDYSIFLWHSYQEMQEKFPDDKHTAMAQAISATITSVVGSSITTIAGFLAMCFMSFTLGLDLGIVMAKGVIFGVLGCVTILPAFILTFDKAIEKTRHRDIIPDMSKVSDFIVNHFGVFAVVFIVVLFPALYGYNHYDVYYNLDATLPDTLSSVIANSKLEEDFHMSSTHMLLTDSSLDSKTVNKMLDEIGNVDGVNFSLGFDSLIGSAIPEEIIPEDLKSILKSENHQLMLIGSEYKVASDEVNNQISEINDIIKNYDSTAMLIGEAPATKDLIEVTDNDFKTVSVVSILAIFLIIAFVLKSASLPIILVAVIETAIFINMGIPAYTGTALPFVASIVIGTIQLGATVDYAILMTTRYKKERYEGKDKKEAVQIALSTSIKSIIVSAMGFFAATFGVGLYSSIDMISSLCQLMSRGAIVSMCTVILVLPSMFMIFDKLICSSSIGFKNKKDNINTGLKVQTDI